MIKPDFGCSGHTKHTDEQRRRMMPRVGELVLDGFIVSRYIKCIYVGIHDKDVKLAATF